MSFLPPETRLYGRRKGRPLRIRKSRLMVELLPQLEIALPDGGGLSPLPLTAGLLNEPLPNPLPHSGDKGKGTGAVLLQPSSLFPSKPPQVWLEIGFGGGEHLAAQAVKNPSTGFIGCEPFINGVAGLLDHIDAQQIKNVRIFADDARKLLDALPDASIDRCFVLFADPWPKARHVERRFIGPLNIPRLARVLKPGAELWLATDVANLAAWTKEQMDGAKDFTLAYHSTTPPAGWVQTRYEEKGIKAGRVPVYMSYRRK